MTSPFCRGLLMAIACLFTTTLSAQTILKGTVLDAGKKTPVPSASIFLNNTSIGTKADGSGQFQLSIPSGRFELIVSSVGYQTYTLNIQSDQLPEALNILLEQKETELEAVVVEPFLKDGWKIWGNFFVENFIGTMASAAKCKILNPEVLKFRHSRKNDELTVVAFEPIIIENKALGYKLRYQLENFKYQFKTRLLTYAGYPFFEPMSGGSAKQKKWARNRKEAYYGSLMHFMRSVYRNKVVEEGFEVRRLKKVPNLEKQRVRQVYSTNKKVTYDANGKRIVSTINQDTANYYAKVLRQNDDQDVISRDVIPGDSIAYGISSTVAVLDFPDYILVIYKHKLAERAFLERYPESSTAVMSQLTLINGQPVEVYANGSYYSPSDLLTLGYWSWSEKIATMLPLDYEAGR